MSLDHLSTQTIPLFPTLRLLRIFIFISLLRLSFLIATQMLFKLHAIALCLHLGLGSFFITLIQL